MRRGVVKAGFGWLLEAELWLALLAGLVLWSVAYQQPYRFQLAVGGDQTTRRRWDDLPYLRGFNAPEPASGPTSSCTEQSPADGRCEWWELGLAPYRWAEERAALVLPGLGGGRWLVALLAGGQPGDAPVQSQWSDGSSSSTLALPNDPRRYGLLARPDALGDLTLQFTTPALAAPGDRRSLGFRVQRVVVHSSVGPRVPALGQLGWLALGLALVYGMGRTLGIARRAVLAGALGLALLAAGLLVARRLELTVFTPLLVPLLAGGYLLQLALLRTPWLQAMPAPRRVPERLVAGLVALAFVLRVGGLVYPTTRDSDIGLNANNLSSLLAYDGLYMTEALPSDIGGAQAPYPPAQYLVAAPALLVTPPDFATRKLLLTVVVALLDSLLVAGIWYVLWGTGMGLPAALCGAALYLLPPPILRAFSIGELGNLSGQALAFPALALLALAGHRLRERRVFWPALALLALALLGHSGVSISLGLLLAALWWLWLLVPARWRLLGRLTLLIGLAVGLVALLYYSVFLDVAGTTPPSDACGLACGLVLASPHNFAVGVASELRRAFAGDGGAALLTALLGLAGLLAIQRSERRGQPAFPLTLLLLAWWSSGLLALLALLLRDQTVRWALFLYPAWCIGAGAALAVLWRWGRFGKLLCAGCLGLVLGQAGAFWVARLADYLH